MRPPSTEPPPLGRPILVLNLKTFPGAVGAGAERIARALEDLGTAHGVAVAICPAQADLGRIAGTVAIPVLAQHIDPVPPGPCTGFLPAATVAAVGARGSLVNHSEHPLKPPVLRTTLARLAEEHLVAVACASDDRAAKRIAALHPAYLAVEPPELIGGDRAVSTARPQVIEDTVRAVAAVDPRVVVLCGAGVHDRRDVARALELGAEGILVASAVAKSPNPRAALEELLAGY